LTELLKYGALPASKVFALILSRKTIQLVPFP
jgi:hypothetical protein